jgi:hypothetical protein
MGSLGPPSPSTRTVPPRSATTSSSKPGRCVRAMGAASRATSSRATRTSSNGTAAVLGGPAEAVVPVGSDRVDGSGVVLPPPSSPQAPNASRAARAAAPRRLTGGRGG